MIKNIYSIILILSVLLITYLLMRPALIGGFYFDDGPVLAALSIDGGIQSLQHWLHFVFSGTTGPLGRPISMASFTLDAQNWPASSYQFKHTNLLIHLFNGLLVFYLFKSLLEKTQGIYTPDKQVSFLIPFLTMTIWLLHPLQLSTIMPIVQRMTELSTTFMLAGMIAYIKTRQQLSTGSYFQQLIPTIIIIGFGLLAAFSKETGILLPVYILIIEVTLFSSQAHQGISKAFQHWKILILYIPLSIIIVFLLYQFTKPDTAFRDYTSWQRFITQPEILIAYLKLLIPQIHVSGYFQDAHPFYKGISDGFALFYLIVVFSLIIFSLVIRKKWPVIAFSILFYFSGHLLESSSLMLELYFEHRNYLPILGIFFAFSYYLSTIQSSNIKYSMILIILLSLSIITFYNSKLWGNNLSLAMNAAYEQPLSSRAHQTIADEWIKRQNPGKAREQYQILASLYPHIAIYQVQLLQADCLLKKDNQTRYLDTLNKLNNSTDFKGVSLVIDSIRKLITAKTCAWISYNNLLEILHSSEKYILSSIQMPDSHKKMELENIYITKANILIAKKHIKLAAKSLKQAFNIRPSYNVVTTLAEIYIATEQFNKANLLIVNAIDKVNKDKNSTLNIIDPRIIKLQRLLKQTYDQQTDGKHNNQYSNTRKK